MTRLLKIFLNQNKIGAKLLFVGKHTWQPHFKDRLFRIVSATEMLGYTVNKIKIFFGLDLLLWR